MQGKIKSDRLAKHKSERLGSIRICVWDIHGTVSRPLQFHEDLNVWGAPTVHPNLAKKALTMRRLKPNKGRFKNNTSSC